MTNQTLDIYLWSIKNGCPLGNPEWNIATPSNIKATKAVPNNYELQFKKNFEYEISVKR